MVTVTGTPSCVTGTVIGPDRLDVHGAAGDQVSCHFLDCVLGGRDMRSEWIAPDSMELLLTALMPDNRRAMQLSMRTGLRISDVLELRTEQLRKTQRPTVRERKTGKTRRVYIPLDLYQELLQHSGEIYVFPGRSDGRTHRTRQAVYKDLRRVATLYRLDGKRIEAHISPHSARKIYAVDVAKTGGVAAVQRDLRHESAAVAMLYAMADVLTEQAHRYR